MQHSYIIDKINAASFSETPFAHLEINDLFEAEDFQEITNSAEVMLPSVDNDEALFEKLFASNYRIIQFPGCTQNQREYIEWHRDKEKTHKTDTSCAGFGIAMRLQQPQSRVIEELQQFLYSREFVECIAAKFDVRLDECNYDGGIQKYLDGYEISPHPDIRRKALTFMVNINPSFTSFEDEYHTDYLQFKPQWNYVREFWRGNDDIDRCWVPWDWCDIKKQQRRNNSIVIFAPGDDSLHAVKADYNHLNAQRTQLYGNLWLKQAPTLPKPRWEDLVVNATPRGRAPVSTRNKLKARIKKQLPSSVVSAVKRSPTTDSPATHAARDSTDY